MTGVNTNLQHDNTLRINIKLNYCLIQTEYLQNMILSNDYHYLSNIFGNIDVNN